MFEEDQPGNQLLVTKEAASQRLASTIANVLSLAEPVTAVANIDGMKTLREALYEQEPWYIASATQSPRPLPGILRLQEKRVNRVLATVSEWLLLTAERLPAGDPVAEGLFELAEEVRQQIAWPEQEAHQMSVESVSEAREPGK